MLREDVAMAVLVAMKQVSFVYQQILSSNLHENFFERKLINYTKNELQGINILKLRLHNGLTLSYSSIWNQNVPQEIPFFIRNQYSAIARKKSNTAAIIVRVKI